MDYDQKLAALFLQNFGEAYRSAKLLMASFERIKKLIPLKAELFSHLTLDDLDKLDAFRAQKRG